MLRRRTIGRTIAGVSIAAVIALLLPLAPNMPASGLDASWAYALNEAVARRLVFGKDLIFTYGPLSSVSTWLYHPATDRMMLAGSLLLALSFCAGFALLTFERRPALFALTPIAIVLMNAPDAFRAPDAAFLALPLFLLLSAFSIAAPDQGAPGARRLPLWKTESLILLAAAIGMLPLVKVSFTAPAVLLGVLSICLLMGAKRFELAGFLAATAAASLTGGWLLCGQPLGALPAFFMEQKPIVEGYTGAMSLDGPLTSIVYWAILAVSCILAVGWLGQRHRVRGVLAILGVTAYFFLAFKAGFVRQDAYHVAGLGALAIAGLALVAILPWREATGLAVIVIAGCLGIQWRNGMDRATVVDYFTESAWHVAAGLDMRFHPGAVQRAFAEANEQIRNDFPLDSAIGSIDVYPTELSFLFAHGAEWAGRPVFQSYSAYRPELDELNAGHLEGSRAPRNVFFAIAPIDYRLPSLEDAASWPVLMSRYDIVRSDENFVQLVHRKSVETPTINPVGQAMASLNRPIDVPLSQEPIWAKIDMKPTALGSAVLLFFKLPEVWIAITLDDGEIIQCRYIPEMGQRGFLLSPYTGSNEDFVLLMENRNPWRVRQITLQTADRGFWRNPITVQFFAMCYPARMTCE